MRQPGPAGENFGDDTHRYAGAGPQELRWHFPDHPCFRWLKAHTVYEEATAWSHCYGNLAA